MQRLFLGTVFFSAFLLFLCQPMMAKGLLPLVGGAPSVWITCMLFFQVLLLGGYAYAAVGSAHLKPKVQIFIHILLMAIALVVALPIEMPATLNAAQDSTEISVLGILLLSIGMPYFLLSANSSLLQRWFHDRFQTSPYHLFAASNIGSMAGLFAYPLVMEWVLPLHQQMAVWGAGFALLTVLFMVIGYTMHRAQIEEHVVSMGQNLRLREILNVVFLGFVPSSLFLSTTLYVTTDIVSFPLLWIIPLALYLLSFILAFSQHGERWTKIAQERHVIAVMATIVATLFIAYAWMWALHFLLFFVIALSCHGQAARAKPEPQKLTAFFFWISVGGALGGLFNTAAPYLFNDVREHIIVLVLSILVLPRSHFSIKKFSHWQFSDLTSSQERIRTFAIVLACLAFAWLGVHKMMQDEKDGKTIFTARNFFGVSKVQVTDNFTQYVHGTTFHGMQPRNPAQKLELTTYYGVVKTLIDELPTSYFAKPFGVIGLGAGTQACYGRKGQAMEFFEIDQVVIDIAKNPDFFTYLRDCPPNISIFKGDGRLEITKRPNFYYNLLVMDAFTSDAVPLHLLTSEAVSLYIQKIVPTTGILAFHITNRHLTFKHVLARIAQAQNMEPYLLEHAGKTDDLMDSPSHWLLMLPKDSPWKPVLLKQGYTLLTPAPHTPLWTDQYSHILPTLKW